MTDVTVSLKTLPVVVQAINKMTGGPGDDATADAIVAMVHKASPGYRVAEVDVSDPSTPVAVLEPAEPGTRQYVRGQRYQGPWGDAMRRDLHAMGLRQIP